MGLGFIGVNFLALASRLTRATGVLVILLGAVHLVATPFYVGWSQEGLKPDTAPLVLAALQLNHALAGVLLLPMGLSSFLAAGALKERWGLTLACANAVVLLLLPVLLVTTMPLGVLNAPLFRLAIGVLATACVAQGAALAAAVKAARAEHAAAPPPLG